MDLFAVLVCLFSVIIGGESQSDKQLYCSVCRVMLDEINHSISQVDPKKKIQTGSFRVDPKGNQDIKHVPYARSETHLTEVIEEVCNRMSDYAQTTDDNGKRSIVRTNSRNGKPLSLKNIKINREIKEKLRFYCDSIIEEHEEELVGLLKRESMPNMERVICGDIAGACTEAELNEPMATLTAEEEGEDLVENKEDEDDEEEEAEEEKEEKKETKEEL